MASGTDENTGKPIARANIEDDQIIVHQELKAHLVAEITTPGAGTTYSTEQTFLVSAIISNSGEAAALSVSAKLTISGAGTAAVVAGDNPRDLGTIIGSGQVTVSWTLECTGSGDVTITVTPAGVDENTNKPIYNITPDTVTILHQEAKAHLVVVITGPTGATGESMFSTGQSFTVKAMVKNTGEASALNVRATIDPGANCALGQGESATKDVCVVPCALEGGHSASVSWTLQCEGVGKSVITVTAAGTDENTGEAIVSANIEPDTFTVEQEERAQLVVTSIESLYQGSPQTVFSSGQEFDVNATVTNVGAADAIDCTGTIGIVGPASLAPGETATEAIGDIPGVGGTGMVSWHLRCTGSGPVTITVTPAGIDENTGVPVISPDDIEAAQIVVNQQNEAQLEVTITSPKNGTTFFVGQEFVVTATVTNGGEAMAEDVSATIDAHSEIYLVAGESETKALGDIAGGESKTVSWTLRCDKAGNSTINVTASGIDANTGVNIVGADIIPGSIDTQHAGQLAWWLIPIIIGLAVFGVMVWLLVRRVRA